MTCSSHDSIVHRRADVNIMRKFDLLIENEPIDYISSIIMSYLLPYIYLDCPHRMVSCLWTSCHACTVSSSSTTALLNSKAASTSTISTFMSSRPRAINRSRIFRAAIAQLAWASATDISARIITVLLYSLSGPGVLKDFRMTTSTS